MIHALAASGRAMVAAFLARQPLLAFDIDGTLAPLVDQPDGARIPDDLQAALGRLAALAPVAMITGRGRADAQRLLAFTPAHVLGNHGVEGLPGWEARTEAMAGTTSRWRASLEAACAPSLHDSGIVLEDKRYSLSLHFRHAPDRAAAWQEIARLVATLVPPPRVIEGKCVVNVLPPGAPTKGDALRELIVGTGSHAAIYAGDDDTDEHVFELPRAQVLGIHVGARPHSAAALFVDSPDEMLPLVGCLIAGVRAGA